MSESETGGPPKKDAPEGSKSSMGVWWKKAILTAVLGVGAAGAKHVIDGPKTADAAKDATEAKEAKQGPLRIQIVAEDEGTIERVVAHYSGRLALTGKALPYEELYDYAVAKNPSKLSGPPADIVMVDDPWVPELASKHLIVPLDEPAEGTGETKKQIDDQFAETFLPFSSKTAVLGGSLLAMPFIGDVELLLYTQDDARRLEPALRKEPGPELLRTLATAIPRQATHDGQALPAFALRGAVSNDLVDIYWELLRAYGDDADAVEPTTGAAKIDGCASKKAINWLKAIARGHERDADLGTKTIIDGIADDKIGMTIGWPYWLGGVLDKRRAEFLTAQLSKKPVMGVWMLVVRADSARKEEAERFIFELASDRAIQNDLSNAGAVPIIKFRSEERKFLDRSAFWKENYTRITEALEKAEPRPRTARWWSIEQALGKSLKKIVFRGAPLEELKSQDGLFRLTECGS